MIVNKIKYFLALMIFCYSVNLNGQNKDLMQLENRIDELRMALVNPTQSTLDGLLMQELSYGHSSGKVEDKKSLMDNLLNGNSNFEEINITDQIITIQKKTAIVRHKLNAKTNDKGKDPSIINLHVLTVWVKDGKQWKLLARQAVK